MKNEEQCVAKLEQIINSIVELTEKVKSDNRDEMTDEENYKCAFLLGCIFVLSGVLDCEDELKPFMRMIKYEQIVKNLERK